MIITKEKEIGGLTFQVTKMPVYGEGWKVFLKVSKYMAEPLNDCLAVIKSSDESKMEMSEIIAVGVTKYLSNICPDKIEQITHDLVDPKKIKVKDKDGEVKPFDINAEYVSYQLLVQLLIFSIEINYASFFLGLPEVIKDVMSTFTKATEEKSK